MFRIRIHGRGGQGAVTAAELLSVAAFLEGRHAQAFPSFGSERTGAPVAAFCRIDDEPIRTREPVVAPDALVVQDAGLLHGIDLLSGLRPDGRVLVNSPRPPGALGLAQTTARPLAGRVVTVPATGLALHHIGRPVPNVVLLGGLAALTGCVGMAALTAAIEERFDGALAAGNAAGAREAYEHVRAEREELTGA